MGKPTGFIEFQRELPTDRAPDERVHAQGLSDEEATMAAFLENMKDVSRVGGN